MGICTKCNDFNINIKKIYKDDQALFLCPNCLKKIESEKNG